MNLRFESELDFASFKNELRERLDRRETRRLDNPGYKPSAVNILLMNKEGELCVLLTKRTEKVSTHKGQISFPGGGYDESDGNIANTVLRETFEEVGIPAEKIECIGRFDDYISLFGFHISCFVGAIPHPCEYRFNEDEIDDYVEAPLSLFVSLGYDRIEHYNFKGHDIEVYHYNYDGYEIWGLTARILTDFAQTVLKD
ncbi:MAG TPA: CoA pyrophosphatase [Spirochaetota bacterium]|nr:CoA pyrophosphatase [Spirochaetota bacterium]HRZ26031.1 CoA pyrophosphatase [Spirochaetota bacterium]HSA15915.1 CoA pyrophosphatase [Spirochaetota bacterium]